MFNSHSRGAPVYVASGQIYSETESNANELVRFALPGRTSTCGAAELLRSRERCKFTCSCRGAPGFAADVFALGYSPAKTPLHSFQPNRYFPAKHLPRPDPTELRAGCVIDTGVLKLTVSASAAGLSGTCKACRCGGCFAGRVHAGTGNAPSGGFFKPGHDVKTWEPRVL